MSNTYFQFKQFRIEQEQCAMKVTTDACIQGAWTPLLPHVKRVLDAGAGTGLLSLMLAQRSGNIVIDGIESDKAAAAQALENVRASPWAGRINVLEGDAREYGYPNKYDLIISNPPFFNNSLLSDADNKNKARHTLSLSYKDLLSILDENLSYNGYASIMLPVPEYRLWKELVSQNGWFEIGRLSVSHRPGASIKRVVGLFSKTEQLWGDHLLVINSQPNKYSAEFIDLLAPFYLDL